jgi:hypothetical protein
MAIKVMDKSDKDLKGNCIFFKIRPLAKWQCGHSISTEAPLEFDLSKEVEETIADSVNKGVKVTSISR